MAVIEERTKELDELYTKATTQEEYHRVWELARHLEYDILAERGASVKWCARPILNGFWARYYELRKFDRDEGKIDTLYSLVRNYYFGLKMEENVELTVNYGYLLSVIVGQLKEDTKKAKTIDEEISRLVKESDNVALGLKVINSRGLNAMQKKDFQEAIAIFTTAEQNFPEAPNIPEARQHLGNTVNNRGLSKLNLSDEVEDPEQKNEMVKSGVQDLLVAMNLYFMVPSIPLHHLEGIKNRLRLAKDKAKEVDPELVKAIEIFVQ